MINNSSLPKVLIVGTLPYNPNESSRALDTYFHNFPKENLRMIYSNSKKPFNDFCSSYFQITDYELIKKYFNRKYPVGTIFDNVNISTDSQCVDGKSFKINKFKKKNILRYYLRKKLWAKKRWLTKPLEDWVNDFHPDMIYVCFSDDYFILDISYYFARKLNIPLIVQIGDDYYFKKQNFLLKPYLASYKKLFDKIMNTEGFGVYISDKLANKYNSYFKKQGIPFYLSSDIEEKQKDIIFDFNYFGKVCLGRVNSLCLLGDLLKESNPQYHVSVYSNDASKKDIKKLSKHNCQFKGFLKYDEVVKIMNSGAFNVIASGFAKKNIEDARYSLSTKVSDSLVCSGPIIAIGPKDDGAIDYLSERECAIIINDKKTNPLKLKAILDDINYLQEISFKASKIYHSEHSLERNRMIFEEKCILLKRT